MQDWLDWIILLTLWIGFIFVGYWIFALGFVALIWFKLFEKGK